MEIPRIPGGAAKWPKTWFLKSANIFFEHIIHIMAVRFMHGQLQGQPLTVALRTILGVLLVATVRETFTMETSRFCLSVRLSVCLSVCLSRFWDAFLGPLFFSPSSEISPEGGFSTLNYRSRMVLELHDIIFGVNQKSSFSIENDCRLWIYPGSQGGPQNDQKIDFWNLPIFFTELQYFTQGGVFDPAESI